MEMNEVVEDCLLEIGLGGSEWILCLLHVHVYKVHLSFCYLVCDRIVLCDSDTCAPCYPTMGILKVVN